jgi:hypothetical protein
LTPSDEELLDWGVSTGRYSQERRAFWAVQMAKNPTMTRWTIEQLYATSNVSRAGTSVRAGAPVVPSNGRAPLFASGGSRPVAMASGADPAVVDGVPWQAALAMAQEPNAAKVAAMAETYSGPNGVAAAEWDSLPGGPLAGQVAEYLARDAAYRAGEGS